MARMKYYDPNTHTWKYGDVAISMSGSGVSGEAAGDVSYANDASGLSATNVQNAIDEVVSIKQDTLTAGQNITISNNVISASGGGFVAQSSAPSDTSVLWVDTDDNTIDETLANADTSAY